MFRVSLTTPTSNPASFLLAHVLALSFLTAASPLASGATLSEGWVSFDGITQEPLPPRVELVSQSVTEVVLRVATPGATCEEVEAAGSDYVRLNLPDYFHTLWEGSAELPAIRLLLAVPAGCEANISVASSDTILFSDCVVYPVEMVLMR